MDKTVRDALPERDNGGGMDRDLLPQAFDLFAQGERSPDRTQGGLGLGLALVKSLASLHGGSVHAASGGIGQGSESTVMLPLFIDMSDCPAPTSSPSASDLQIMIVDDNVDAADSLALLLEAEGHQVSVEYSEAAALAHVHRAPPRVCLLDIGLPDMDGYALARKIRAVPEMAKAVLIALTGYGQEEDHAKSWNAGFDYHLVKPARAAAISALLAEVDK